MAMAGCGAIVASMIDELLKTTGQRIRDLREKAGHSQEGFAAKVGLSRAYFGRVERGAQNMSLVTLARIADVLGVEMSDIVQDIRVRGIAAHAAERETG